MIAYGKFSLHINLTKWLSRCEGSFPQGKEKNNYMVIDDDNMVRNLNKEHKNNEMTEWD